LYTETYDTNTIEEFNVDSKPRLECG